MKSDNFNVSNTPGVNEIEDTRVDVVVINDGSYVGGWGIQKNVADVDQTPDWKTVVSLTEADMPYDKTIYNAKARGMRITSLTRTSGSFTGYIE